MRHNNLALMAVSEEPDDTRFQETPALHDWYLGADDWVNPSLTAIANALRVGDHLLERLG